MNESLELSRKEKHLAPEGAQRDFTFSMSPLINADTRPGSRGSLHIHWRAIRQRLWMIIGITILTTVLAAIYMARQRDVYEAQARVQIDLENNPAVGVSGKSSGIASNTVNDPTYFSTQLQILTGTGQLRRVVKTLDLEHNQDFLRPQSKNSSTWRSLLRMVGLAGNERADGEQRPKNDLPLPASRLAPPSSAEDLEEANNELQQFAYVTSHDLREPLRMITGFTQSLEKRYKDKLDKTANEYIDFIVDGATRMQNLIDDILAYSRVGTRGIPFEQVDMEKALADVLTNLKMAIEETDARITHDPLPVIPGDPVQMMQVLQNLISNAIKFHQEGEAPVIHVSARQEGHEYVFSVKDNGIGIDPEVFGRLFILFQRLHTRDKYPGTGVGLAITKKIVGRHGGRTKVESQPGKGSTFYFSIPDKMKSDEHGR